MIYILDAYNVIHKIRSLEAALDKDLRTGRDALIKLCAGLAASRGDISRMILVFDGKSEFRDLPQNAPPKITLVFSETGEDADERIGTLLSELPGTEPKWVVSDDNSVLNHARVYKARAVSVSEFGKMFRPAAAKNPGKTDSNPALSPKQAQDITAAYKKALGLD